jgi:hypothetical protein
MSWRLPRSVGFGAGYRARALDVIEPSAGRVARTTFFLDTEVLFPASGLPMELPEQGAKIFSSDR